jgi:hypothetical protein
MANGKEILVDVDGKGRFHFPARTPLPVIQATVKRMVAGGPVAIDKSAGSPAARRDLPVSALDWSLIPGVDRFAAWLKQKAERESLEASKRVVRGQSPLPSEVAQYLLGTNADVVKLVASLTTPKNVGQIAAATVAPEVMLPYWTYTGAKGALMPRQTGESSADYTQRVLFSLAQVAGTRAGMESPLARDLMAQRVERGAKGVARFTTRTGPRLIEEAQKARAEKVAEVQKEHGEKTAAVRAAEQERVASLAEKHAERVTAAQKDWARRVAAAHEKAAGQEATSGRRSVLQATQKTLARRVMDNVQEAHRAVRAKLNARWDALRQRVGVDTPVDVSGVDAAIERARSSILRGAPEDLKIFDTLLQEHPPEPSALEQATVFRGRRAGFTGKAAGDVAALASRLKASGMAPEEVRSSLSNLGYSSRDVEAATAGPGTATGPSGGMSFDGARIRYTALGEKMASGGLAGNVYRALRLVHEAYGAALKGTAETKGAGAEYDGLLRDWSRYMGDWNDMSAVAQGGSPLARVLRAADPAFAAAQFLGKAGDRLLGQLARYRDSGANVELASQLRRVDSAIRKLPRTVPRAPAIPKFERPTAPSAPPIEAVPKPQLPPEVDPERLRLEHLAKLGESMRRVGAWRMAFAVEEALRGDLYGAVSLALGPSVVGALLEKGPLPRWIARD